MRRQLLLDAWVVKGSDACKEKLQDSAGLTRWVRYDDTLVRSEVHTSSYEGRHEWDTLKMKERYQYYSEESVHRDSVDYPLGSCIESLAHDCSKKPQRFLGLLLLR